MELTYQIEDEEYIWDGKGETVDNQERSRQTSTPNNIGISQGGACGTLADEKASSQRNNTFSTQPSGMRYTLPTQQGSVSPNLNINQENKLQRKFLDVDCESSENHRPKSLLTRMVPSSEKIYDDEEDMYCVDMTEIELHDLKRKEREGDYMSIFQ